jgi:hypothetical protein
VARAEDVKRIAMSLAGTISAPHFDRTAFKVARIYATLGSGSVNLMLTPEEQEFKVMMAPEIFAPIPNAWGRRGWTVADVGAIGVAELEAVLTMAWEHGRAKAPKKR